MERRIIAVSGVVQGVGFRPFVYGLAKRLDLGGSVKNQGGSVLIEIEGDPTRLDRFLEELHSRPPPLARIDSLSWERQAPRGDDRFCIEPSDDGGTNSIFIGPDVATCDPCLAELFDPADRRYRYPFLNCTNCGPRLTIVTGAPYDRARTTMSSFPMCAACRAEYEDPGDRRFHAQPIACPACGPRLRLLDARGQILAAADPLADFATELRAGRIGAIKGLGGYHLACDAGNDKAVREIRRRKHRDERPFALMARDFATVEALCEAGAEERALLHSSRRPIVLLHKRPGAPIAGAVAPGNPYLGIMLPYTPLHHLLMHELGDTPVVLTSGNRTDEPIAYDDGDAIHRLSEIADLFLAHDRPIHVRCDDSVTRVVAGAELPVRRSRGDAPMPIPLPVPFRGPVLAVGGQFKGTFALGRDRHAFLSHHLGDLDHFEAFEAFRRDIALYEQLFAVQPGVIVHDLHPDYASTIYAQERTATAGGPMKYQDEYRDPAAVARLRQALHTVTTRRWTIMEACGGQTHTIVRYGIDQLLPPEVELVHGPGCPVCVTPLELIDNAVAIAAQPGVIFCSFGDMLRVPGSRGDLFAVKAAGGDVRVVYSPLD